ncbi:MAG: hypothetical protein Q7R31_01700 [Candidatus Levybacteria bacterium]|nr:hypothetical protein [Candidatus Levybacteria bacterium]
MKDFFRDILNGQTTRKIFIANLSLVIITCALIALYYHNLPPFIPIFNQLPWGEQRLGSTATIFIPPLIAFIIFICNIIVAGLAYEKIPLVSRMLATVSLLASILIFLFIVKVIQLII